LREITREIKGFELKSKTYNKSSTVRNIGIYDYGADVRLFIKLSGIEVVNL